MPPEPATLNLTAAHAKRIGIPVSLAFCVVWGESQFDLTAEGDRGLAHGLIQVRTDVHGHDRDWWIGLAGAERSLALMAWRWTKAWKDMGQDAGRWERDPVGFLKEYWPRAQGANATVVAQRAADVVRDGMVVYRAWADEEPRMAVEKPPLTWFGAAPHNYTPGRNARIGHEAIVIHTTAGSSTIEQLAAWFGGTNRDRNGNLIRGSTNFGVDVNGAIGQFVALTDTPIANGQEEGASGGLLDENRGINANLWTISVEHLDRGVPGTVTDIQFERSAWLSAWLFDSVLFQSSARPVPTIDRTHVLGHYQFAPASRSHCPSWPPERWDRYIARVAAIVETGNPEPPRDLVRELLDVITVEQRQHQENEAAALALATEERIRGDNLQAIIDGLRG